MEPLLHPGSITYDVMNRVNRTTIRCVACCLCVWTQGNSVQVTRCGSRDKAWHLQRDGLWAQATIDLALDSPWISGKKGLLRG